MKRLFIFLVLAVLTLASFTDKADAQCKQQLVYQCATQTEKAIYLRDFNTKLKRDSPDEETGMKWTVVLNKGTQQIIVILINQWIPAVAHGLFL